MLTLKRVFSKVIPQSESQKRTNSLFQKFYLKCLTFTLATTTFPNELKKAEIRPVYKNDDPFDKTKL